MASRDPQAYHRFQRAAEWPMLLLSLAFIPVLVVPMALDVSTATARALETAAWIIWGAFVFEYLVLLYLAPNRWHMVRTHVFDLVIIVLPFLRPLRAARILRLIRATSGLGRATVGLRRITARPGFRGFLAVAAAVITLCAGLAYVFEHGQPDSNLVTFADALWWAIVTATTVGYGDRYLITPEGRGIAVVLMLVGIGLLSVVTANIAAFFIEDESEDANEEIRARLDRIERLLEDRQDRS